MSQKREKDVKRKTSTHFHFYYKLYDTILYILIYNIHHIVCVLWLNDRRLVSIAGTVTLVNKWFGNNNMFKTKATVPAGNTSFLSTTLTVWFIILVKYIYEMNIFYGEDIGKIRQNALTHCSVTLTVKVLFNICRTEDRVTYYI